MQHQIAAAEGEVGRVEELVLVNMLELDELNVAQKTADAALKSAEAAIAKERAAIEADVSSQRGVAEQMATERGALTAQMTPAALDTFQRVAKARQGVAVAPTVSGHCSICHVRCDSCQRILYYTGSKDATAGQAAIQAAELRQRELERPS
jgi:predicted  nucleic acid-binding Zn-ribbon protein